VFRRTSCSSPRRGKAKPASYLFSHGRGRNLLLGLLLSSGIGILAYRRKSLSRSGIVGATISGTTIYSMGGWRSALAVIFFFVSSSLLSHFRAHDKAQIAADKFSKGSQRDIGQVAANGGVATLVALGYGTSSAPAVRASLEAAYVGALATATADTWATELGVLSSHAPRLLTTGKPTTAGTSGGITLLGTIAAAAGSLALGLFYRLLLPYHHNATRQLPFIALISGLAGSFFDSFLGETVQAMYYCPACHKETERQQHSCGTATRPLRGISWLNNDGVNLLATAFGALVAMLLHLVTRKKRNVSYPDHQRHCVATQRVR
jgi:uncharacterized protein (TIGR00297 family)